MSKILYLITFLSVVLFKSETSFAQELKKELGICGKTFSAIMEMTTSKTPQIRTATQNTSEFCDNGRYEQNANFIVSLFNSKQQMVHDKKIYLNPMAFAEMVDDKKGTFKKTKIRTTANNSRIVKFPISAEMGDVTFYKVKSLETNAESELRKIKW